jgi:iron complex outermembrane receptor protein
VRPSDEFTAYLTGSLGNYGLVELEGAVGGPVVPEVLSFRVSGTWGIRDGLTKNRCAEQAGEPLPVPPPCNQELQDGTRVVDPGIGDRTNDIDYWAARGQLLYTVPLRESSMEWLLNVHGGQNNSRAFQYQHRGVRLNAVTEEPIRIGGVDRYGYKDRDKSDLFQALEDLGVDVPPVLAVLDKGDPFGGDYDIDGPEDIDVWGANLKGIWLFGDDAYELQSLTAYEWNDRYTLENTDAGPKFGLQTTYENTAWQVSQQFDLRGPIKKSNFGDGNWLLGLYYLQEDLDVSNFYEQVGDANLLQEYSQDMWNLAPYGQVEYRLQPGCEPVSCDFTLLAGARFNVEHKEFDTGVTAAFGSGPSVPTLVANESETWTGWSGGVTLTWNLFEDVSLFGKYTRGWKGGHFNGGALSSQNIISGVDPEIIDAFEAGLRSSVDWGGSSYWADGLLSLEVQGFYYDYQNLQVFIIEQTDRGFPIAKLVNAADAQVYGVEVDLLLEPIPGLNLGYHFAWVESEYKEFVISINDVVRLPGPCPTCPPTIIDVPREFDYTGNTLIASPRFSMTGSIEYAIPLQIGGRSLGTLSPRFSFSWKDSVVFDPCGGQGTRCNFTEEATGEKEFFGQEPFWVLNGALTWWLDYDRISMSFWVRNFLDEHYKTQSFDLTRGARIILDAYADPRTYGVTATFSY